MFGGDIGDDCGEFGVFGAFYGALVDDVADDEPFMLRAEGFCHGKDGFHADEMGVITTIYEFKAVFPLEEATAAGGEGEVGEICV